MKKFSIPIRLKVLVTVVTILMVVVGVITSTMANLFHQDKTAYVRDYSFSVTEDIRAGTQTILGGYVGGSRVLSEVLFSDFLDSQTKQDLIKPVFSAYPELLALVSTNWDGQPVSLYNSASMQREGVEPDAVLEFVQLQSQRAGDSVRIRSVDVAPGKQVITLALEHTISGTSETRAVVVVISPALIRQVLQRAGAFDAALLGPDGDAVVTTGHPGADAQWARQALQNFDELSGSSVIEYEASDGDYIAGIGKIVAGDLTVVTRISASAAYLTARQLLKDLVMVGMAIVILASLGGVVVSRRITRPLEHLSRAVGKIAKGNFDVSVRIESQDEIGQLSNSFNEMADELNVREASLKKAQLALVQSEKMAAVGTLSAGLAHEVKNPLSAVLGYAQLAKRKLEQPEALKGHLDIIENETRRCNEIIGNLMQFSRAEKGEFSEVSINAVIEKSIGIVDHQLSLNGVSIEKDLADDIPPVLGIANQLQQVLMNLSINAQQAMGEDGGTVSFSSAVDADSVLVTVDDTGPGIPDEVAANIFEPFFTTKEAGEGTGLGLSVTYGIIQEHDGDIRVLRNPNGGARFEIRLPINAMRETGIVGNTALETAS